MSRPRIVQNLPPHRSIGKKQPARKFLMLFHKDMWKNTSACPIQSLFVSIPAYPTIASVQVARETIPVTTEMLSLLEAILGKARRQASAPQEYCDPYGPPEAVTYNPRSANLHDKKKVTFGNQVVPLGSPAMPGVATANPL